MNTSTKHVAVGVTPNGISFFLNNKSYSITRDNPAFHRVTEALRAQDYDAIPALMDTEIALSNFFTSVDKDFEVKDSTVFLHGKPFTPEVSEKVLRMVYQGMSQQPLLNFLRKVRQNPSSSAQRELLLFCVANGFMIHEDGDIIAYKAVQENYTSKHAAPDGTFVDNSVGVTVSMDRAEVDDRRDVTCSFGLHFAAHEYARGFMSFGDRMVVIKVNPVNVVSIPADYRNQKGRCCGYEVISEIVDEHQQREGLPMQEVYSSEELGVESGVTPLPTDLVAPEREANSVLYRLATVVAKYARVGADFIIEQIVKGGDPTLHSLGVLSAEFADLDTDLDEEFVTEHMPTIFWLPTFATDVTVRDLMDKVLDPDDYNDDEEDEEEAQEPEDFSVQIAALKEQILSREIFDHAAFRNAVSNEGIDIDDEDFRDALRDEGLSRWL